MKEKECFPLGRLLKLRKERPDMLVSLAQTYDLQRGAVQLSSFLIIKPAIPSIPLLFQDTRVVHCSTATFLSV